MSTTHDTPVHEQPSRGVSVPHLVMGLVFLGLAGSWMLRQAGVIGSVEVELVLPLVLVVAGAAGLLASMAKGLVRGRSHRRDQERFVTDDDTP